MNDAKTVIQEKKPEVVEAINILGEEFACLDSAVTALLNKIQPVVASYPEPESKIEGDNKQYNCEVASRIENTTNAIIGLRKAVKKIHDKVQI